VAARIGAIEHAIELIARFARDRELQAACEVGADDFRLSRHAVHAAAA
jgi:predicted urease superfamily metal-dependent hydrolase